MLLNETLNPVGNHSSFPGSRSCQNHHRTVLVADCRRLRFVKWHVLIPPKTRPAQGHLYIVSH